MTSVVSGVVTTCVVVVADWPRRSSLGAPIIGLGGLLNQRGGGAICGAANANGRIAKITAMNFIFV